MTKLQLLHRAVSERLQAAVEQIMEMVGGTVLEYEEETVRARTENEILRRRLRWMEGENATDWPDPTEHTALSASRVTDFSQSEKQHDNMEGSLDLDALIIKTESIDASDFEAFGHNTSLTAAMCGVNLETGSPGTSAPPDTGLHDKVIWESNQSYMAPLDFDPTLPIVKSRSQRMSFACPDCGKVFGREQRLMFHMRVHSTERPYAYRRRKTCFYGDKKRKKKLRGLSKLSREFVEDLSDTSEHTERSTGSANISVSVTADPSAPEAEPGETSDGISEHTGSSKSSESSATKPVALKPKQKNEKTKIHQCQQCNRAYTQSSRLAIHMRTHEQPLPSQEEPKEQGDTDKTDKKSQQHVKVFQTSGRDVGCSENEMKAPIRNNETEVAKAKAVGQSLFHCPECNKIFARSCWLSFHLKSHIRERALACRQEKKKQLQSNKVKNVPQLTTEPVKDPVAESSKENVIKKIFACPYCDKVFTRAGWLAPHIRNHTLKAPQTRNMHPDSHSPNSAHRRTRRNITQPKEGSNEAENVSEPENKTEKPETMPNQSENITSGAELITVESETNTEPPISNKLENTNNESEAINIESNSITNKMIEEPIRVSEEPSSETGDTKKSKKIFPCRECGKVYLLAGWLKTHKKMHKKERILEEKRRQQMLMDKFGEIKSKSEGNSFQETAIVDKKIKKNKRKKRKDLEIQLDLHKKKKKKQPVDDPLINVDKASIVLAAEDQSKESGDKTSGQCICKECGKVYARKNWLRLHMLGHSKALLTLQQNVNDQTENNDGQASKGGLSTENSTVQKGKDGGKASFPCPFCDKVFPRSMRLMVHMQIHSGEKPYSYRQRKEQFYSDLPRTRAPDPEKTEPALESSDERKIDGGNEMTRIQTPALIQDSTSTSESLETIQQQSVHTDHKFSLLPLHSTGATTIHSTNHSSTDSKSDNHFSLQPRIVLDQITAQSKQSESGWEDLSPGTNETSNIELDQVSDSEGILAATETQVNCSLTQPPLENTSSQNTIACTDIDKGCFKLDSVCKSLENTSCSEKVSKGDQQTSECSVRKSEVWRNSGLVENCDYSVLDGRQNPTVDVKPTHTTVNSSYSANQQVPHSETGYMVFSDVSDEDDWTSVSSNNPDEKKLFISTSEELADKGTFFISTPSFSQKANDSDMKCKPNKTEEVGPLINRDKMGASEEQRGDSGSTEQENWFTCLTCGTVFASEATLIQHMKVHAVSEATDMNFKTLKSRVKNNERTVHQQVLQIGESIIDENASIAVKVLK